MVKPRLLLPSRRASERLFLRDEALTSGFIGRIAPGVILRRDRADVASRLHGCRMRKKCLGCLDNALIVRLSLALRYITPARCTLLSWRMFDSSYFSFFFYSRYLAPPVRALFYIRQFIYIRARASACARDASLIKHISILRTPLTRF